MKIAILWTQLSGYLNSCIKELAGRDGVELLVIHEAPGKNSPFDEDQFGWIANRTMWRGRPAVDPVRRQLRDFTPGILVIAGWHLSAYRRVAKEYRRKCLRVMCMDNPWAGTLKQWLGILAAPYYLQPAADMVWVPGERQAVFARKLGFRQSAILRGLYACDRAAFEAVHLRRLAARQPVPRCFLYVGRFMAQKGLDTLVEGYRLYRKANAEPWPLVCCGAGPLRPLLEGHPGVRVLDFVQPRQLPDLLASAGCLVLSSVFEPWALVIHEAASAGLLVLASEKAGAAVHLVQPNYNGFIFGSKDAEGLAAFMSRCAAMSDAQLDAMSQASHALSEQFSPQKWADTLLQAYSFAARAGRVEQGA